MNSSSQKIKVSFSTAQLLNKTNLSSEFRRSFSPGKHSQFVHVSKLNTTKTTFKMTCDQLAVQALLQTLNSKHTFCISSPLRRHWSRLSYAWYISAFQGNKDLDFLCLKNIISIIGYLLILVHFFNIYNDIKEDCGTIPQKLKLAIAPDEYLRRAK